MVAKGYAASGVNCPIWWMEIEPMYRIIAICVTGFVLTKATLAEAQNTILSQLYGNGVHAYFSFNYTDAHRHLTSAVDGGSKDPRVFYFRALALRQLGRSEDAESDFRQGAKLEMMDVNWPDLAAHLKTLYPSCLFSAW